MDSPGRDNSSGVEEHFHETDEACVMDFDAWDFGVTARDGQCQALEEGEVDMDLKGLSLKGSEMVEEGQALDAHGLQMLNAFLKEEILQVIAAEFMT
jgi:hypothetical protein